VWMVAFAVAIAVIGPILPRRSLPVAAAAAVPRWVKSP
jgi:hypothetical protein